MGLWRPATKIRFWTPKFRHRSYVQAPGFLKLVSAFAVFSIVGTILYYIAAAIGDVASSTSIAPREALYVAGLHFLLPFVIALAITTNSVLSRPLIVTYFFVLSVATALGQGTLGALPIDGPLRVALSVLVFAGVSTYLYLGPKMRAYYALLRGNEVPRGTGADAVELVQNPWPGRRGRAVLGWLSDHLETIVIVGLIVTVILAWRSMNA
ncbi:MAG: hypothetical protein AAF417_13475 [Pseudomonadota bacterium]